MTKGSYPEDRVEALLTQIKLPPSYRIFPTQHAKTPLGTALFASRLTGEDAYVIFDHATSRLTAGRPEPLALHIELPDVLRHHGISLITRT